MIFNQLSLKEEFHMGYRPLPIGTDDFKKLISNGSYYVDKTLLIKELLDKKGEVNLFTRPRRFGKTLNLSMLQYFFEDTGNGHTTAENGKLFDGLKIMDAGQAYTSEMGQYPVISLSLKSARQPTWELAYLMIRRQIAGEFERHQFIMESLTDHDRARFQSILQVSGDPGDFLDALNFLSKCLNCYFQRPVIILIDEYDVPLENAYFRGFYQEMVDFVRSLFESALKTNPYLHFAVITGCLRITKESIFTGLNNLKINSILSQNYGEYFGFTKKEMEEMLSIYHCTDKLKIIQKWYDGYSFGNIEVYNPWSVLNYIDSLTGDPDAFPITYWSNTSSNNVIRSLIEKADLSVRAEIEDLIAGKTIEKPVHEDITYEDVYATMDNLWNFLFFTGYLRMSGQRMQDDTMFVALSIPNTEIRQIYKTKILGWFQDVVSSRDLTGLYRSILDGDVEGFERDLTAVLQDTISFYDNVEAFYHGFMAGILGQLKTHIVKSNRESGDGRYDIMIRSLDITKPIVIMEIKAAKEYRDLDHWTEEALKQIREKEYDREFAREGYQKSIRYGIAFYKKACRIKMEKIEL